MKKDQEDLLNTIENVLSTLSSEYIVDMFLTDYHKPYWLNRPSINKNTYLDNTINTYMKYHEDFDIQRIQSIKAQLREVIDYDEIIDFKGDLIYKELYKILWLIEITFEAEELLLEKDYPRDFGKLQSDMKTINTKRALYKNLIVGDDRLLSRKEVRLKYWTYTLYYKNKNLLNFFLHGFLIGDLIKIKALHEEGEIRELFLSNLEFFLMQKTTIGAVLKSLGILLYGEMTHYLKIPKNKAKEHIDNIIYDLFNDSVNTDEFYGHIAIKSSLGHLPIFGSSKHSKYSDEEKEFIKSKLLKDIQEFSSINKDTFEESYNSYIKNPHIQFLTKYPQELLRENPKHSALNS